MYDILIEHAEFKLLIESSFIDKFKQKAKSIIDKLCKFIKKVVDWIFKRYKDIKKAILKKILIFNKNKAVIQESIQNDNDIYSKLIDLIGSAINTDDFSKVAKCYQYAKFNGIEIPNIKKFTNIPIIDEVDNIVGDLSILTNKFNNSQLDMLSDVVSAANDMELYQRIDALLKDTTCNDITFEEFIGRLEKYNFAFDRILNKDNKKSYFSELYTMADRISGIINNNLCFDPILHSDKEVNDHNKMMGNLNSLLGLYLSMANILSKLSTILLSIADGCGYLLIPGRNI